MARQRRTLDEQIAELVTRGRSERYNVLSTPAMSSIGSDMLEEGAVRLENLDDEISQNLAGMDEALAKARQDLIDLDTSLGEARRDLTEIDGKLDDAAFDLVHGIGRIDEEIIKINDAAAKPLTDARFTLGSLTVWPFQNETVPRGALAQGAVGSHEIADFSMVAKKFKDDRHRLY